VLGLRQGLSGVSAANVDKIGTVIYADWTTSEKEKELYKSNWLYK